MPAYKSVDQSSKDSINAILVRETLRCRAEHGCIITLDDETNGTISSFVRGGYSGAVTAVQRDKLILSKQQQHFRSTFGRGHRFTGHVGDICRDFASLCNVWVNANDVDLWNFDFMGTFQVETSLMLRRFLENPPACMRNDEPGTLVGFTFQAIGDGQLLTRFKNVKGWTEVVKRYKAMKSWTTRDVVSHYLKAIDAISASHKPTCVSFEPVTLQQDDATDEGGKCIRGVVGNAVLYGGARANDSTMMFALFRARHDAACTERHAFVQVEGSSTEKGCREGKRKWTGSDSDEGSDTDGSFSDAVEDTCSDTESDGILTETESNLGDEHSHRDGASDGGHGEDDAAEEYVVDKIIAERVTRSRTFYQVTWKGFGDVTWEPEEHLADCAALDHWEEEKNPTIVCSTVSCPTACLDTLPVTPPCSDVEGAAVANVVSLEQTFEFDDFESDEPAPTTTPLYDFQRRCVDLAGAETRGFFNIVCGAGKTVIMERILSDVSCGVLFEPSKILVDQVSSRYFSSPKVQLVRINSDHSPGDEQLYKPTSDKSLVIIANLQSIHNVHAFCTKHKVNPEVICYDEAHRYTSHTWLRILGGDNYYEGEPLDEEEEEINNISNYGTVKCLYRGLVANTKNFFFTATPTPPMYRYEDIFGKELLRYTHKQGVDDGIVKNFDTVIELCRSEDTPRSDGSVCYPEIIKSVVRLAKERALRRILIYTRFVVTSSAPVATVEGLWSHRRSFPRRYRLHIISASTSNNERQGIFESFRDEDDEAVHVIISCRTLSEGVDLVNCDCVVNLDPSKSIVQAVQRGTRPCRLTTKERSTGKWRNATLFYPVNISTSEFLELTGVEEKRDDFVHSQLRLSQFEYAMRIINYLKNDFDMNILWSWKPVAALKKKDEALPDDQEMSADETEANDPENEELSEAANSEVDVHVSQAEIRAILDSDGGYCRWGVEGFDSRMNYLCVKLTGDPDEKWMGSYLEAKTYIMTNDYPKTKSGDVAARQIARWLFSQRNKASNNLLKDWQKRLLDDLPGWSWEGKAVMTVRGKLDVQKIPQGLPKKQRKTTARTTLSAWESTYAQIAFSGEPTRETQSDWYRWCTRQRSNYLDGSLTEKEIELLEKLTWWKWDANDQEEAGSEPQGAKSQKDFDSHIRDVRTFVDQHQRLPKESIQCAEENRMAQWLQAQRYKRKQGDLPDRRSEALETLPGWFWSRDLAGPWWTTFEKVKTYCESHGAPPSAGSSNPTVRRLGQWVTAQRANHRGKRHSAKPLTEEQVSALEALPGWFWEGVSFKERKKLRVV